MRIPTELNVSMSRPNGVHGAPPAGGGYGRGVDVNAASGGGVGGYSPYNNTQDDVGGYPPHYPQHALQHAPPLAQQQPQHAFSPAQFAMNTPWKLGSTDGTYAMNVAIRKQQQEGGHSAGAVPSSMSSSSSSSFDAMNSSKKQQQHTATNDARLSPLLEDGVATNTSTSQAITPNVNNLTTNPGGQPTAASQGSGVMFAGGGTAGNKRNPQPSQLPPPDPNNKNTTNGPAGFTNPEAAALIYAVQGHQSIYQDLLFRQPCGAVEAVLAAACEAMHFDIAEMWLRTGPKTHQLTNSHLRPTALEDSVRRDLVDVYYGDKSSERTHRLSPALCKRAKEASDVVWVTGHTPHGADALRASISNVRTAVAIPVCHEASNTNITIIFFSIRRYVWIF